MTSPTSRESGTFDFKEAPDPPHARELAKDVAAFANALGAVIIVGTVEDKKHGTLGRYRPSARVEAAEFQE